VPRNLPALTALSLVAVLGVSGCAGLAEDAGASPDSSARLEIVATTTQVADFTRNVVGDTPGVSVTQLVQPNQSAHSYDPSAADLADMARADVLVNNGLGLEEWLGEVVDASGFDGTTITAADGVDMSGDPGNPHIWTSVVNAEAMVATIADGLAAASPAHAADFEENADAYGEALSELDTWIHANVDPVPSAERLLVSNHDAFGHFTAAYGITYVGSIMPNLDDNAEPSAADIETLVDAIRDTGVRAVFSEASISPKAAETISREAGVAVYSGADALYGDSLGPRGSAGDTYIHSQVHNLRVILESWGVEPGPLNTGEDPTP
jgi:zinc/manganese transport system substrate-binding protein/manganese/iron transport system substrate-binding protein